MIITKTKKVRCARCGKKHLIRQYEGLAKRWWTDHRCEEKVKK